MARQNVFHRFCLILTCAAALAVRADTQGVVVAPTAAAYQELTNVSYKMLKDLSAAVPRARTVILYDAGLFSVIPYYSSTTDIVRKAAASICTAETEAASSFAVTSTFDVGGAAQGLAGLIQLTIPSYAVQGQALPLDNSALVGSFATAAKTSGYIVVNPAYLLPAVSQSTLNCKTVKTSDSLADLWRFANAEEGGQQSNAVAKPALKDALDGFDKLKQVLTASDKGVPILGRALAVESLAQSIDKPEEVAVVDMRLDMVDVDSTTKSVLWRRKSKFSAGVAAHYWIFSVHGSGAQFGIALVAPGYANILRKDIDLETYTVKGNP